MSMTFTKLFSSITESSIWQEADHVRLVWITMLAMSDRMGRVWASIPGLASRARVSVEHAEAAIALLKSPDKYSRTPDNEGRRIEDIDGGWRLLNHRKYREIRDAEASKESKRKYAREKRARVQQHVEKVERSRTESNAVECDRYNAEAAPEAYISAERDLPAAEFPNWPAVSAEAGRIGLAEWKAQDWFNEMEGCGWKDHRGRQIFRWQAVLTRVRTKWEADGRPTKPMAAGRGPSAGAANNRGTTDHREGF